MKITVRQLKQLIREATYEAMQEVGGEDEDEKRRKEKENEEGEAPILEAVKAAYRAGLRKGRSVRR